MPRLQQRAIANLLAQMDEESPLIEPELDGAPDAVAGADEISEAIQRQTGMPRSPHAYAGWLGVVCPSVRAAVWMMRALLASNVLARREDTTLFVPLNRTTDSDGRRVIDAVVRVHAFARVRNVL